VSGRAAAGLEGASNGGGEVADGGPQGPAGGGA